MPFVKSERLRKLPPYLFAEIDRKKKAAIAAGRDVINLGVGDPDRPTPPPIIESLQKNVENPAFHQYALDQGAPELRRSIAAFCRDRYGLDLDPDTEILPLIGSKEGIAHLPLAVLNPGDISLVPDPCYPVYRSSSMFAGADVYSMTLEPALGFRPDLDAIPGDVYSRARLMFLNYPNNPTGGGADLAFFRRVNELAEAHDLVIAQDAAYNEMYFDEPPPSLLQVPGAKERAIEFHSLSKTFNMTGWRVGFAIGGAPLIAALGQVKANVDSGIFTAIQFAGKTALDHYNELAPPIRALYRERRDAFVGALRKLGWEVPSPSATFYVWIPCPKGYTSTELCTRLLEEANVVTTPGVGFGRTADGYI
ncbi:MAG: LL-diaminopimelate aminotransferase, partial [Isosphaeraceae bacterium]